MACRRKCAMKYFVASRRIPAMWKKSCMLSYWNDLSEGKARVQQGQGQSLQCEQTALRTACGGETHTPS